MARTNPIDVRIGRRIQECRLASGVTTEAFAKMLGVSVAEVHEIEVGAKRVDAPLLFSVASILRVSVADFYNGGDRTRDEP